MTFACCPCRCGKSNLARLLARRPEGVFINPFERGELGPSSCLQIGAAKRRDRPYQAGRSKYWVKVKNRKHPAMEREL